MSRLPLTPSEALIAPHAAALQQARADAAIADRLRGLILRCERLQRERDAAMLLWHQQTQTPLLEIQAAVVERVRADELPT